MIFIELWGNSGEVLREVKDALVKLLSGNDMEIACNVKTGEGDVDIFIDSDAGKFYIVNPAHGRTLNRLASGEYTLITCGLSGKACVTASSIAEDGMQICIQRSIPTCSGYIEPQEFHTCISGIKNSETALSIITAALVANAKTVLNASLPE